MFWFTPLPPLLYEIINCALFTGSTMWLVICIRYLASAYVKLRKIPEGALIPVMTQWEALNELYKLRVAIGLTIFLCGESPRMGYLWVVRYLQNTGHDVAWLSQGWWIFVPVIASTISVIGCACSVRAIIPEAWGRHAYVGTLALVICAVVATQVIRL